MNEIKERLRRYKEVKALIYEYEIQIAELEESIGCGGVSYEDKGGQTYKISRTTEEAAVKLANKKAELKKLFTLHSREVGRIDNALNALNDLERQAVEMKYIDGYGLETIMYKMDRQKRAVLYCINDGLKKMDKILNI